MDRFKLRAYIKKIKSLREVTEIRFDEKYPVCIEIFDRDVDRNVSINYTFDEVELIQCTGLKDKNGNLIYEGDILKDRENYLWEVRYSDDFCGFQMCGFKGTFTLVPIAYYRSKVEILGNIYENANLLKHA